MPDIKTRDVVKGTIKTIDKAAIAGERMKSAYIATKEKAEHSTHAAESSVDEYAADKYEYGVDRVVHESVHQLDRQGRKGVEATKENIRRFKEKRAEQSMEKQAQASDPVRGTERSADSPVRNAADSTGGKTVKTAENTVKAADSAGRETVKTSGEKTVKTTESSVKTADRAIKQPARSASNETVRSVQRSTTKTAERTVRQSARSAGQRTIKAAEKATEKTVKQTARSAGKKTVKTVGKGTVKAAGKTVKTAERTAKTAIKTTQQAAKAAQRTAQASAKAAKAAAHAARVAAKAAVVTAKALVKATVATVKAIIAGVKALVAAIAAGGWVAVVAIIIICLIALLLSSVFGIFFSGEDSGTGQSMQTAVAEINTEYDNRLMEIRNGTAYDVLEMSGSRAVWKEVLSVYAVKTNTDPDNPQEVTTMDDTKKQLLSDIFWEMNEISSSTSTTTETVITETDDGNGNIIQTETQVTQTYLYITVSHKTVDEMAAQYGFNQEQKDYLTELLDDKNNSLWAAVLYGINAADDQIVTVALSQVGNMGGDPYWSWYGFESRVEWCACFVSWCANECGYIETGVIPKYASCANGIQWFKDRDQWIDGSAEPVAGMIIFFDWDDENGQDGVSDHTGIVQKVEDGIVYTVEGNSGDSCRVKQYAVGHYEIFGYGVPQY